jgi:hypothetical protein
MSHTHIISIIRVCFVDYGCTYNSSLCCLCIANVLLMCCLCVAYVLLMCCYMSEFALCIVSVSFCALSVFSVCVLYVTSVCFVRYRCVFCTLPVCVLYDALPCACVSCYCMYQHVSNTLATPPLPGVCVSCYCM